MRGALIDTNIFLEVLLEQERADEAAAFLNTASADFYVTDFSIASICINLIQKKRFELLRKWLKDLEGTASVVRAASQALIDVVSVAETERLDYDDAYQLYVARAEGLELVTFDADFNSTSPRGIRPTVFLDVERGSSERT